MGRHPLLARQCLYLPRPGVPAGAGNQPGHLRAQQRSRSGGRSKLHPKRRSGPAARHRWQFLPLRHHRRLPLRPAFPQRRSRPGRQRLRPGCVLSRLGLRRHWRPGQQPRHRQHPGDVPRAGPEGHHPGGAHGQPVGAQRDGHLHGHQHRQPRHTRERLVGPAVPVQRRLARYLRPATVRSAALRDTQDRRQLCRQRHLQAARRHRGQLQLARLHRLRGRFPVGLVEQQHRARIPGCGHRRQRRRGTGVPRRGQQHHGHRVAGGRCASGRPAGHGRRSTPAHHGR